MHAHHVYTKLILDHSSVDVLSNEMHAHHVYTKLILDHSSVDVLSNEMHAHHVYMKSNNCFWNIRVLISQPITCISHHVVHATSRNWFWNIHVLTYQPMKSTLFFYTTCMGSKSQLKQLVSTKKSLLIVCLLWTVTIPVSSLPKKILYRVLYLPY